MATTTLNPCSTFYFIHLDENGKPIPGTMFAKDNAKIDKGYKCTEAALPNTQSQVPAGKKQCFGPNHLRYYYKVNSQTGQVLSNSFWSQLGKPESMCTGVYKILEYKIWN